MFPKLKHDKFTNPERAITASRKMELFNRMIRNQQRVFLEASRLIVDQRGERSLREKEVKVTGNF